VQAAVPFTSLYLPDTHKEHTPPFGPVAPTLHTHDPRAVLDAGEMEKGGQLRHAPAPVAPTVPEYVFTPQSIQLPFPVALLYFPAPHSTHTLPFPLAPALHRHSTRGTSASAFAAHDRQTVAPTPGMYVPAAQDVQLLLPITFLYWPGTHSEHGPPFAPVAPALHVHAVTTELPKTELELTAHATQTSDALAPAVTEYVPALQFAHVADVVAPVSPEYVPAMQFVHALAPAVVEYAPGGQFKHTLAFIAPVTSEYVPAKQLLHCPVTQYLPLSHKTQPDDV